MKTIDDGNAELLAHPVDHTADLREVLETIRTPDEKGDDAEL